MNNIRLAIPEDIKSIADYQMKLAQETQDMKLDSELVHSAVQYLVDHKEYGFYIVCTNSEDKPCGALLITYENERIWWIQSVYVVSEQRRKGNFKRLFETCLKMGQDSNAISVKLYVTDQNKRAQNTYLALGMHYTGEKFFGYDLVYGDKQNFKFLKQKMCDQYLIKAQNVKNVDLKQIPKVFGQSNQNNKKLFAFRRKQNGTLGQLFGICEYFIQFSDWRHGFIVYFNIFYCHSQNRRIILEQFQKYLYSAIPLTIGAVRLLLKEQQMSKMKACYPNMHYESYQALCINL